MNLTEIQNALHVPKSQRNTFGNYNYRSCEDILETIKPVLLDAKATLSISDEVILIGDRVYVKATVKLTTEDGLVYDTFGYAREAVTKKGMDEAQITGACSSYARKYALAGLFLLDDNRDFDTMDNRESKEEPKNVKSAYSPEKDPKVLKAQRDKMMTAATECLDDMLGTDVTKTQVISFIQKCVKSKWKREIPIDDLLPEQVNLLHEAFIDTNPEQRVRFKKILEA